MHDPRVWLPQQQHSPVIPTKSTPPAEPRLNAQEPRQRWSRRRARASANRWRRSTPRALSRASQIRGSSNSRLKMARPNAMVRTPGPGSTIIARPASPTTPPPSPIITRFPKRSTCQCIAMRAGSGGAGGPSAPEEDAVGGVCRLFHIGVAQVFQVQAQLLAVGERHLHTRQHPALVGAVVAIVEQADVPARADGLEEAQQRARTFGEFEAEQALVGQAP